MRVLVFVIAFVLLTLPLFKNKVNDFFKIKSTNDRYCPSKARFLLCGTVSNFHAGNMQIEANLALAARRGSPRTLRIGITKAEREQFRDMLRILDLGLEDRLIMMYEGRIALDIAGEEKEKLTVEDLLVKFGQATGSSETTGKLLLS